MKQYGVNPYARYNKQAAKNYQFRTSSMIREEEEKRKKIADEIAKRLKEEEERKKKIIEEADKRANDLANQQLKEKNEQANANNANENKSQNNEQRQPKVVEQPKKKKGPFFIEDPKYNLLSYGEDNVQGYNNAYIKKPSGFGYTDSYEIRPQETYDYYPRLKDEEKQFVESQKAIYEQADSIYDTQIQQLQKEKEMLQRDKDSLDNSSTIMDVRGGSGVSTSLTRQNLLQDRIDKIDEKIDKLNQNKTSFISAATSLTDPREIRRNFIAQVFDENPEMERLKVEKNQSFVNAKNIGPGKLLGVIRTTYDYEYSNALKDFIQKSENLKNFQNKAMDLEKWVGTFGLPTSLDVLPDDLQETAKILFKDKEGNDLLNDQEFRKQFNMASVVDESQYGQLLNASKNFAENYAPDRNEIERLRDEFELMHDYNYNQRQFDKSSDYSIAMQHLDNALRKEELDRYVAQERNAFLKHAKGFGTSFVDFATNLNTYTFSAPQFFDALNIKNLADKSLAGGELTESEKDVFKALTLENAYNGLYSEKLEDIEGRKWGEIAFESLQFMASFMLTRGALDKINAGSKKIANAATRAALKQSTKLANTAVAKMTENLAAKHGVKNYTRFLLNAANKSGNIIGGGVGQAAYSVLLANTLGAPRTYGDALKDATGYIQADINRYGQVESIDNETIQKTRSTLSDAIKLSQKRQFVENFSEMMGEWGMEKMFAKGIYKAVKKTPKLGQLLDKIEKPISEWNDKRFFKNMQNVLDNNKKLFLHNMVKFRPEFKQFLKSGQYHGVLGETMEEYYGIVLNHMLGSQESELDPNKNWFQNTWDDMKNQTWDIVGGIALSTAMLGIISNGAHLAYQGKYHFVENKLYNAFGKDLANDIRKSLIFSSNRDISETFAFLLNSVTNSSETMEQKNKKAAALIDYYSSLLGLRGAVYGQEFINRAIDNKYVKYKQEAEEKGYTLANYHTYRNMQSVVDILRNDLSNTEDIKEDYINSVLSNIDKNDYGNIYHLLNTNDKYATELANKFLAYANAKAFMNGVNRRLNDTADFMVEEALKEVNRQVYNDGDFNSIRPLVRREDPENPRSSIKERMYLVSGNVKHNPFGMVDADEKSYGRTDKNIVVYVPTGYNSGYLKTISVTELEGYELFPSQQLEEVKKNTEKQIRKQWYTQRKNALDRNKVNPGKFYQLDDEKVATIVRQDGEGIIFTVADKDGNNVEVKRANSVEEFNRFIENKTAKQIQDITKYFNQTAYDQLQDLQKQAKEDTSNVAREDYMSRQYLYDKYGTINQNEIEDEDEEDEDETIVINSEEKEERAGSESSEEAPILPPESTESPAETPVETNPEPTPQEKPKEKKKEAPEVLPTLTEEEKEKAAKEILGESNEKQETKEEPPVQPEETKNPPVEEKPKEEKKPKPVVNSEEQQRKLKELEDFIEEQAIRKKGVTSVHYIIEENGKTVLKRRVHDIIGGERDNTPNAKEAEVLARELYEKFKAHKNDKVALENAAREEFDKFLETQYNYKKDELRVSFESSLKTYIENYDNIDEESRDELCYGLAKSVINDVGNKSVIVGNIFDVISRYFFDYSRTEPLVYDDKNNNLTVQVFIDGEYKTVHISDEVNGKPLMTEAAFYEILGYFELIKKEYDELGWKIITTPFTLSGKFEIDGHVIDVAGETDAIAIDENGNSHIIDFKTHNTEYSLYHDEKVIIHPKDKTKSVRESDKKSEFFDVDKWTDEKGEQHSYVHSTAAQYARQLFMYRMMYKQLTGNDAISTEALMFQLMYQRLNQTVQIVESNDTLKERNDSIFRIVVPKDGSRFNSKYPDNLKANRIDLTYELIQNEEVKRRVDDLLRYVGQLEDQAYSKVTEIEQINIPEELKAILDQELLSDIEQFNESVKLFNDDFKFSSKEKSRITDKFESLSTLRNDLIERIELNKQEQEKRQDDQEKWYNSLSKKFDKIFNRQRFEDRQYAVAQSARELKYILDSYKDIDGQIDFSNIENSDRITLFSNIRYTLAFIRYCKEKGEESAEYDIYVKMADSVLQQLSLSEDDAYSVQQLLSGMENDVNEITEVEERQKTTDDYVTLISKGEKGVESSHVVGDESKKLTDFTTRPDFINNSTFVLHKVEKNGKVAGFELVITYKENDKEYEFTPVEIFVGSNVRQSVNKLLGFGKPYKKYGAPVKIKRSAMSRTFGVIVNTEEPNNTVFEKANTIQYSSGSDFALTKTVFYNGVPYVVAIQPSNSGTGKGTVRYTYSGQNVRTRPSIGTVVYLHQLDYQELPETKRPIVPINIMSRNLTEGDAKLIVDILTNSKYAGKTFDEILNQQYENLGITNREVISLLIPFGQEKGVRFESRNRTIYIVGNIENYDNSTPIGFDLDNQEDIQKFKQFLTENIRVHISENILKSMLGSETFDSLRGIFDYLSDDTKSYRFGESSIVINSEDILNNISGLEWYVKSGMLYSNFDHLENPLISITEDDFIDDSPIPVTPEEKAAVVGTDEYTFVEDDDDPFGHLSFELPVTENQLSSEKGFINEQDARKHLQDILGDVPVEFIDEFLSMSENTVVLGSCYTGCIKLSRQAIPGVEYHEAFHRIVELLIPAKQRENLYKKYKHIHLHRTGEVLSDRQVAEAIANGFWSYIDQYNNIGEIKLEWRFWRPLKKIIDHIKLMKSIGSFGLYRFYRSAKNGEFRNVKPTEEAIKRFNEFTNNGSLHYSFTKNGVEFKNILNDEHYDDLKKTLQYFLLHSETQYVDDFGRNLDKLDVSLDTLLKSNALRAFYTDTLQQYSTYSKKAIAELLGIDVKHENVNGKNVIKFEIINDNWNKIQQDIVQSFKEFYFTGSVNEITDDQARRELIENNNTVTSRDEIEEETSDLANETENSFNSGANAVDGHLENSNQFDPITRASVQVKFFFSRIVMTRMVTVKINGVEQQREIIQTNRVGAPQFFDVKLAWGLTLLELRDCVSSKDIYLKLKELSANNSMFKQMLDRYVGVIKSAYSKKDGSNITVNDLDGKWDFKVKNYDQEALLIQIFCALKNAYVDKQVIKAYAKESEDREMAGSLKLESTDLNYTTKHIRDKWNSTVTSGGSKYITVNDSGRFILKDGYSRSIFNAVGTKLENIFKLLKQEDNNINSIEVEIRERNPETKKFDTKLEKVNKKDIDLTNNAHLYSIKKMFVETLNDLGASVTVEDLDFMIQDRFGSSSAINFVKFLQEDCSDINTFIGELKSLDITSDQNAIRSMWKNDLGGKYSRFSDMLSNGVYKHVRSQSSLSVLTINGKKLYLISENNFITDRVDELLQRGELLDNLMADPYYLKQTNSGFIGSIVFKNFKNTENNKDQTPKLEFLSLNGIKTDSVGSVGIEYTDMSKIEQTVSKYALLAQGLLIAPTLAGKTTYGAIKGVDVFGFNYGYNDYDNKFTYKKSWVKKGTDIPTIHPDKRAYSYSHYANDKLLIHFPRKVLEQFVEYAKVERDAAEKEYERFKSIMEKGDTSKLVKNYHYGQKIGNRFVVQGARFSTFTGIIDEQGNHISFNNLHLTEKECFEIANDNFFNKSKEEQLAIMERTLSAQVERELEYLQREDMITKDKELYDTKMLDNKKIKMLYCWQKQKNTNSQMNNIDKSDAIIGYVADMVIKGSVSIQEMYRIFGLNPAYYTWNYDKETGKLSDLTQDFYKRLGGLVSTGTNNCVDIPGMKQTFNVAEVSDVYLDFDVAKEFADEFEKNSIEQVLRQRLKENLLQERQVSFKNSSMFGDRENKRRKDIEEINEIVSSMSIEEVEKKLGLEIVSEIKQVILNQSNALRNKTNIADGATYITDEMCENLLRMTGKLNNEVKRAFEILRNHKDPQTGKKITNRDVHELAHAYSIIYTNVIGTQKYTAYGQRPVVVNEGTNEQYVTNETFFDKTAYFPIFECICSSNMLMLLNKLKEQDIQMLKLSSAIKVGSKGLVKSINVSDEGAVSLENVKINDSTFEEWKNDKQAYDSFKFNSYEERYRDIRKQFNTDPKEAHIMSFGTQMVKVLLSVLSVDQSFDIDGKTYTADEFRDLYMSCINEITACGDEIFTNKMFDVVEDDEGNKTRKLNVSKFSELMKKELASRDANSELIDAFDVIKDESGELRLKNPLAAMSGTNWIQSIITSMINKDIIEIKSPGSAFYQRSVFGMEGPKVISDEDVAIEINNGKRLQVNNEKNSMDCVLSIDFFDYIFEQFPNIKNQSFEIKKQFLINHGIISGFKYSQDVNGEYVYDNERHIYVKYDAQKHKDTKRFPNKRYSREWNNAETNIVGYRIPTQAVSSIHAMRCVDVINVVRHTVVLPSQITSITGSDFDIDKFFLSTMYYKKIKQTIEGTDKTVSILRSDEFDENSENAKERQKHFVNKLLQLQIKALTSSDNNINKLHGPIDSDTKPLTEIADEMSEKYENGEILPFESTMIRNHIDASLLFNIGKDGIGPYALNNNNHVLTMLYGVKFNDSENGILKLLNLEDLSKSTDRNGHSIMSWLSGLINAHVDVEKDPYISKLGVNKYSYNLVSLLIRTGYGKETFYFTTQPIMEKIYRAYKIASGVYMQEDLGSVSQRQKNETEKIFIDHVNNTFKGNKVYTLDKAYDRVVESIENKLGDISFNSVVKTLMIDANGNALLKEMATRKPENLKSSYQLSVNGTDVELSLDELQAIIGYVNFKLQEKAQSLSNLVQYTKIDTKKHGKTLSEQRAFLSGLNDLTGDKSPFELSGITSMIHGSFIYDKTRKAIMTMRDMLESQLFEATSAFEDQAEQLKIAIGTTRNDADFMRTVSNMIQSHIKQQFFFGPNGYCAKRGINPRELLTRKNYSIYDRLIKIQNGIDSKDPNYTHLLDENGNIQNYLLRTLVNDIIVDKPFDQFLGTKFVKNKNSFDDNIKSDYISKAWADLLNDHEHKDLQKFAEDLIVYSFITSADNGGRLDLFKFVPPSWRSERMEGCDESYSEFISRKLNSYQQSVTGNMISDIYMSDEDIDRLILNYSWDDAIVKTISQHRLNSFAQYKSQSGVPLIIGAVNEENKSIFDQNTFPKYIKVKLKNSNFITTNGQHSYGIYKYVGNGIRKQLVDGKPVETTYPIYVLTAPFGGKYGNGQKIFDFGITNENKESDFYKKLLTSVNGDDLYANTRPDRYKSESIISIYDLFNSLAFGNLNNTFINSSRSKNPVFSSIVNLVNDYKEYVKSLDGAVQTKTRQTNDNTSLDIDKKDDRYTKITIDQLEGFDMSLINKLINRNYNIEFYKKKAKDGKSFNYTVAVSLNDRADKGFFEINANIDLETRELNGQYSVHFKTMSVKSGPNEFASSVLSEGEKNDLFSAIGYLIPMGSYVSTYGELTPGGVSGINKIGKLSSTTYKFVELSEKRSVKTKEGESIEIPIFKKVSPTESNTFTKPLETKPTESQSNKKLETTQFNFKGQKKTTIQIINEVIKESSNIEEAKNKIAEFFNSKENKKILFESDGYIDEPIGDDNVVGLIHYIKNMYDENNLNNITDDIIDGCEIKKK